MSLITAGLLLVMLSHTAQLQTPATPTCNVTAPSELGVGNERLSAVGLWPNGALVFRPGGPGFVTADGSLGMKFGWQRGITGQLAIEGRRLDAEAPPLRAEVPGGYGSVGFQPSYIIFPTPGCWEVTGRVSDESVTFVTSVVKIGDGPSWRRGVE